MSAKQAAAVLPRGLGLTRGAPRSRNELGVERIRARRHTQPRSESRRLATGSVVYLSTLQRQDMLTATQDLAGMLHMSSRKALFDGEIADDKSAWSEKLQSQYGLGTQDSLRTFVNQRDPVAHPKDIFHEAEQARRFKWPVHERRQGEYSAGCRGGRQDDRRRRAQEALAA